MQLARSVYYLYFPSDHGSSIKQLAPATLWDSMDFPESLFQQQASQLKQINIQELLSLCFTMVNVKIREKYLWKGYAILSVFWFIIPSIVYIVELLDLVILWRVF